MQHYTPESLAAGRVLQAIYDGETQFENALDRLGERNDIDGDYSFVKLPSNRKWKSFTEAAATIRSLEVTRRYIPILGVLFHMAHVNKSCLFPNLRSLKWTVHSTRDLMDISRLIVPTLVNFSLELHDLPPEFLQNIYQCLTVRISRLKCLQIGLPDNAQIAPQAIQILANLLSFYSSTLTQVQIPTVLVIPSIIQCLSGMPNLCGVDVGFPSVPFPNLVKSSRYVSSNRQVGYFLSLQDFSYRGTPQTLYNTFSVFNFVALSVFHWDLEDGLYDMKEFLRFIELSCSRLTTLTLGRPTMYPSNRRPRVVSWDAIQGLLECRYLTSISIHSHCARVDMNTAELSILLRSRTTWKKIEIYTRRPLALKDMFLYGKYCPNLTSLGMHLDIPAGDELDRPFPTTIPRLHELDLGHSNIPYRFRFPIGAFLYKISRRPVYVQALDHELWQDINEVIASLYKEQATRTIISAEVMEYMYNVQQDKENMMDGDDPDDD